MDRRKVGNTFQVVGAYDAVIGGKNCVIAYSGGLEVIFSKDNALDVSAVRFNGVNVSFLSKNGLNDGKRSFTGNFEGGFLYTCGMDNVSDCVEGKPIHGSLHYKKAENVSFFIDGDKITVCGEVSETALFGKNLVFKRKFTVTPNSITVDDEIVNNAFTDADYVLLYHVNYGYPFLDECLKLDVPSVKTEPKTEIAKERFDERLKITYPVDGGDEDVYYHTLKSGRIGLLNPEKGISVTMNYSVDDFPVTLEWKSMISGDYALGIEPSLTRFDEFKTRTLKPAESKNYKIEISFDNIIS